MKKILTAFCCLGLLLFLSQLAFGAPQSNTDRKLKDLSNRFSSLEASWGRFQIGGNFALDTNSTFNHTTNNLGPAEINQQFGLSLDAFFDQNLQLASRFSYQGGWGLPIMPSLQVDEVFLKLAYPNNLNYLGRFRFSLGPLGVFSDFFRNPVQGLALQHSFDDYHVIGLYSRDSTQYTEIDKVYRITLTSDYWAVRVGWSNQTTILGMNLVNKNIKKDLEKDFSVIEKDFSLDWSFSTMDTKMAAELGWYDFSSTEFPAESVDWIPGLLISYGKTLAKDDFMQLKAGYFAPGFTPSYSSLAHSSGEDREWFVPNSKGIELYLQNGLKNGYGLENRLIVAVPIKNSNQSDENYRWRSSISKNFSPFNQIQLGIDLINFFGRVSNQLFAKWTLQF